jgi:hypothetical protein
VNVDGTSNLVNAMPCFRHSKNGTRKQCCRDGSQ